ncbi:hypothetical protein Cgig2_032122 [Carnegiea gigantea]|uniref:Uncharacterized protein n=1 Tax=Carnegiea gigantea TaxID=171969 RepID=A0A9Q1JSX6_9CARY|nr:hypothetical protein Cgig2_032122 [Carnegiea gigantea]
MQQSEGPCERDLHRTDEPGPPYTSEGQPRDSTKRGSGPPSPAPSSLSNRVGSAVIYPIAAPGPVALDHASTIEPGDTGREKRNEVDYGGVTAVFKFIIPNRLAESYMLKSMGRKLSNFKANLKLKHYESNCRNVTAIMNEHRPNCPSRAHVYVDTHKDRKTRPIPMDEKSKQDVVEMFNILLPGGKQVTNGNVAWEGAEPNATNPLHLAYVVFDYSQHKMLTSGCINTN